MSNIIHKVKDALTDHGDKSSSTHHDSSNVGTHHTTTTGHSSAQPLATGAGTNTYESTHSSNHGPHDSNIANKVDPRVDSDRDNRAAYGSHNTSTGLGSHNTTTGVGSAGLATGTGANAYESTHSSNHGPHDSNIANKVDPRVDSDLDNRAAYGSHSTSTGHSTGLGVGAGAATGAAAGAMGHHAHESSRSSNHGPHDSNIANKVDPRVDSDLDNRAAYGSHNTSTGLGSNTATTGTGSTGLTGHHGTMGGATQEAATHSRATGPASSTAGPHESNLANKADPRVDSDLSKETSGRFDKDVHKGSIGGAGVIPISGNAGPTSTKTFEEAQHTGTAGAGSSYNTSTTGTGLEHKKTAGPHKSDLANKLDPRVDSDLDGSKTIGGSQRV